MSGRLKAVTIVVAVLYAAGVVFFVVAANGRRNLVEVPDLVERELAIPADDFSMLALELDKYAVVDDLYDADGNKVAGAGEVLTTKYMRALTSKQFDIPSEPSEMLAAESEKHTLAADVRDQSTEQVIARRGDTLSKDVMTQLLDSGIRSVRVAVKSEAKVLDQREIASFVSKELVAMDDVKGAEGTLVKAGTVLGREQVDALREAGIRHVRAQGFGSIVGLNGTMAAVVLNFLFLTFFLYVYLWRPVVGVMDARANTITGTADKARGAVSRAEEAQRERSELDRETRRERMKILEGLTAEGRKEANAILSRARGEADRVRENARSASESTLEQLGRELEPQLPTLASQVTTKLLGRAVPPEAFEGREGRSDAQGGEG